jgi:hypothetical protein
LESQLFTFFKQQTDSSFIAVSLDENPIKRKPKAINTAIIPGMNQFLFFISVGFLM